jgi:hypothetical protein
MSLVSKVNHGAELEDRKGSTVAAHPFLQKQSGPMRRQAHCGSDSQTKWSDHGQRHENPGAVENSPRH